MDDFWLSVREKHEEEEDAINVSSNLLEYLEAEIKRDFWLIETCIKRRWNIPDCEIWGIGLTETPHN